MTDVHGHNDPEFAPLRALMEANLRTGREIGASFYANVDGQEVVDLWGGWRDRAQTQPWTEDTIVNVFSSSKTVASLAVLMLHDRGQLDIFAPVAKVWPEFAANGKEAVEIRHILSHGAGLAGWEPPFTLEDVFDQQISAARLAGQRPWWQPGTRSSYHPSTFGTLVSEIVRRVTGDTLGAFIARELAGPLEADFHLGLSEANLRRVAPVYETQRFLDSGATNPPAPPAEDDIPGRIGARTRETNISTLTDDTNALFNSRRWRQSEFAGSNGHTNARGLGRIICALGLGGVSRGVRLVSPETIALIFREQFNGIDGYFLKPIRWGIGFALGPAATAERCVLPFLRPGGRCCFWFGRGGSFAIADPDRRITLAYAMNQSNSGRNSPNGAYYEAFHRCLDALA